VATTASGRRLELRLAEDEVFEDLAPRLVSLGVGEPAEILAIVSRRRDGARLVMIRVSGDRLEVSAESAAIGTPMRWLNPVGAADLDGDGRAEVAAVITPHIGGTLKVYARRDTRLVEIAALAGFSNHVYRSTELALSMPFSVEGRMRLLVPDMSRRELRVVGLEDGRLAVTGRCALSAPAVGPLRAVSPVEVTLGLESGEVRIVPGRCPG
jgi:hypothetical protein